jgi:hypothetical protein
MAPCRTTVEGNNNLCRLKGGSILGRKKKRRNLNFPPISTGMTVLSR